MKKWMLLGCVVLAFGSEAMAQSVSLKNFRRYNRSLSVITGVPTTDRVVAQEYAQLQSRLPRNGTVDEMTASMLASAVALSSIYCAQMYMQEVNLENNGQTKRMYADVALFGRLDQLANAGIRNAVIDRFGQYFWGRAVSRDERIELQTLVNNMRGSSNNDGDGLRKTLLAMCTSVATSLDSLVQ